MRNYKRFLSLILSIFLIFSAVTCSFAEQVENEADQWFPFTIPYDDKTDNIINVGKLVLDAPAGKHGFLKVKDGHFYFEDGTRIRFWGVNLSGAANFPTHENAEIMADHIAKYGFNIVRLHHMDTSYSPSGIFNKSEKNTLILDEEQLDRLDYLISKFKEKGIYVDINLLVGRKFTEADGAEDAQNLPNLSKYVTLFDRKLIDLQKDYAQKLLTHVNKYTGLAYNQDPCVAMVEIANENSLFPGWEYGQLFGTAESNNISEYYMNQLDQKWNEWLKQKYGTTEELKNAWEDKISDTELNMLENGGFETSIENTWKKVIQKGITASFSLDSNDKTDGESSLRVDINQIGSQIHMLQVKQLGVKLEKRKHYLLKFKAKADKDRNISVIATKDTSPWTNYGLSSKVQLNSQWKEYEVKFMANQITDENDTRISFVLGECTGKVWLDEVVFTATKAEDVPEGESLEQSNIKRTPWKQRFSYSKNRLADNTEFYYSVERDYFREMLAYIHNELGVRVPVSTTNGYYGQPNLMARNEGDFIDTHKYWDHPKFPRIRWDRTDFEQTNLSMVSENSLVDTDLSESTYIGQLSLSAVDGKPLVVSEWNHVFPNDYEYEGAGVITAYALLQDWDGVFIYTYSNKNKWDNNYIDGWFNLVSNPIKMAQMPACAVAFINGDFKPARENLKINYSKQDILNTYKDFGGALNYNIQDNFPLAAIYTHKIRKALFDSGHTSSVKDIISPEEIKTLSEQNTHTSDTGEITWSGEEKGHEYVKFNTDKFQGATGFVSGKDIVLNNLQLNLSTDCSVFLNSMDQKPIGSSGKMLLTLVAKQKNTSQVKDTDSNGFKDWGKPPVLLEPVKGTIGIKFDDDSLLCSVYALDPYGNRLSQKAITQQGEMVGFEVGNDNTIWYEIVRENNSQAIDVRTVIEPSGAVIGASTITANVSNAASSITVNVTVSANANWKLYSDVNCTNEISNKKINLNVGSNTAYIKVTAQDNTTAKIYTLTITREASTTGGGTETTESPGDGTGSGSISTETDETIDSSKLNISGLKLIGKIHELGSEKSVEIKYTDQDVLGVTNFNKLGVYTLADNGEWKYVRSKVDKENKKLVFNVPQSGKYAIMEYTKTFTDVPAGHWAKDYIEILAARQITKGIDENNFAPTGTVTRAQFAAFIVRALGIEAGEYKGVFSDVPVAAWYAGEVEAAEKAGLIQGVGKDRFNPDAEITREEMAVMIMRAYQNVTNKNIADEAKKSTASFKDSDSISAWAKEAVYAAQANNIINGMTAEKFEPKENAQRSQIAKIIIEMLRTTGEM